MHRLDQHLNCKWTLAFGLSLLASALPSVGWSQDKPTDDSEVVSLPSLADDDGYTDPKVYSKDSKLAACKDFNNKYISYYDKVYFVEDCLLREVQDHNIILDINIKKKNITPVDSDVIAKIEKGLPLTEIVGGRDRVRPCNQLEGKYVTFTYTDVFYIDQCAKRPFPDWASFIEHRKQRGRLREPIAALTWKEFATLKTGESMPSILEGEFNKLLAGDAEVDVIPIDEACEGINNRDVSYVDKIYRIEKCRRREYDAEAYLRAKLGKTNLLELTSEQWLSLPEGAPMTDKNAKAE